MNSSMRILVACCLVAVGYFLGSSNVFKAAHGQTEESLPSEDALKKVRDAYAAMKSAREQLKSESRYESVTKELNPYAVLVGGLNVKEDLESGHGIDPDSFAALNVAIFDIKKNNVKDETLADWVDVNLFSYDSNGRLMYRNKVVRVYSISRLRRLNSQRLVVLDEVKDKKQ